MCFYYLGFLLWKSMQQEANTVCHNKTKDISGCWQWQDKCVIKINFMLLYDWTFTCVSVCLFICHCTCSTATLHGIRMVEQHQKIKISYIRDSQPMWKWKFVDLFYFRFHLTLMFYC